MRKKVFGSICWMLSVLVMMVGGQLTVWQYQRVGYTVPEVSMADVCVCGGVTVLVVVVLVGLGAICCGEEAVGGSRVERVGSDPVGDIEGWGRG